MKEHKFCDKKSRTLSYLSTVVDVCRKHMHIYSDCGLNYPQGVHKSVDRLELYTIIVDYRRNNNTRNHNA